MIRNLITLILVSFTVVIYADSDSLFSIYHKLLDYGPRHEGTDSEQMAFDSVAERLNTLGISYERHELDTVQRGHSYSEVIEATIPGGLTDRYILASPMESGAFSTALLLEIAENLTLIPPRHSVTLLFLGGEQGRTPFHPYGSRYAIETLQPNAKAFVVLIDAEEVPKTWKIQIGGEGVLAPYWLTKALMDSIASESVPHQFEGTDIHVANLGLQGDTGSYSEWLKTDIPTVSFRGRGSGDLKTDRAQINRFARTLLDVDLLASWDDENKESIYIYFHPFESIKPLFIRELPFIILFLGLISVLVSSILLQYRAVYLNFKKLSNLWWNWPLLFFLVFLYLFLATLLIEGMLRLKEFPTLWNYAPGAFLFFKFVFIGAFALNFILFSHGVPLPRTPHFYSYTAVTTSYLLTLVLMPLDITLAFYFLWVSCALSFFAVVRKFKLKILFLILAIVPYILILTVILTRPYMAVLEYLIMNRITGNLISSLALLPIILALACLNYWHSHYRETSRNSIFDALTLIMNLVAVITLAWLRGFSPFDEEHIQPIKITDSIDFTRQERWLEFDSPGPMGDTEIVIDGDLYSLSNIDRKSKIAIPLKHSPLTMTTREHEFLGKRTLYFTVAGEEQPQQLNLLLNSNSPFILHSASQPYEVATSGQEAKIFVGSNPPFPFDFQLTISHQTPITLSIEASLETPQDFPVLNHKDIKASVGRTIYTEYTF